MHRTVDRKLIIAFCKLVNENDEKKLTVSSLSKTAGISRATFYLYYQDFDVFLNALKEYIVKKLFKEAMHLLFCSDSELRKAVKKENLFFDEYDFILLKYFTSNKNYFEFCCTSFVNIVKYSKDINIPEELLLLFLSENKEYEIFTFGYISVLYMALIDYDEDKFIKEIVNCRSLFKLIAK